MPPSWPLALSTLAGRPGRTALMVGAIALAASLVVAVACAIGSVRATVERSITKFLGAADARIIHQGNGRFNDDLLATVRSWPEVDAAAGRLLGSLTLVHADHRLDSETGELLRQTPMAVGVDTALERRFRATELESGVLPSAPDEILIDPLTAERLKTSVGDVLEVQRFGEPIRLKVTGVMKRTRLGAIQRPLIEIDRRTLAQATNWQDQITSIYIILKNRRETQAFCDRRQAELPEILALEPAELVRAGFDRQIDASRLGFIVASVLTFMSASFIIVTALTTSVTEKQREMAVTRCVGASRAQLFASQLTAGVLLSMSGAAIGVPLGIALSALLAWRFGDLLTAGLHIPTSGVASAIIGSVFAGLLGALYPAWMASRVSPLQAMTFRARPTRLRSLVINTALALGLIGCQLALLLQPDSSTRFYWYVYAGLPLLLLGYFLLATPLLVAVTWALSSLLSRSFGLPPGMLRRSLLATPFRHGFTAGALMVGVAILVSTWSNMTSVLDDWAGKIKIADGFAFRSTGISPVQQQAIASLPFVEEVCPVSYLPLRVYGRQIFGVRGIAPPNVTCLGFDPDVFFRINAVDWAAGDAERAVSKLKDGSGVIVADRFLATQKVTIGDQLTLGVGRVKRDFEIVGAVSSAGLDIATQSFGIRSQYMEYSISCVFMDWDTVVKTFDNRDAHLMQLNLKDGVSDEEAIRRIAEVAPGVQFNSGRWIMQTINEVATAVLAVESTIAFAALVLACLGVGNVILANIHSRRYEYGVLRAVGAGRSLLASLILSEAALLAITGALTGTLLGLHLAWMGARNYNDLLGLPVRLIFPELPAASSWAILVALTLLAAIPGVWSVIRRQPGALLAAGRNG